MMFKECKVMAFIVLMIKDRGHDVRGGLMVWDKDHSAYVE